MYYNRNEEGLLETITKQECSSIEFTLDATNNIESVKYIQEARRYFISTRRITTNARTLKGFIWREDEQPKTMEDIFVVGDKIPRKKEINTSKVLKKKE